jgi:hypothetical protein
MIFVTPFHMNTERETFEAIKKSAERYLEHLGLKMEN